ncbi:MAG: gamma-glutamyl-gamma-aminobutyrate hydrolase family protein [Pseudomonadota bacterium]
MAVEDVAGDTAAPAAARPVVLIPCDVKQVGIHPFHCVGEKYINAVAHGARTWPLLVPALGAGTDLDPLVDHVDLASLLDLADGVFLPGSVSNVEPRRYGGDEDTEMLTDPQRDALALDLVHRALEDRVPLFAVCRGMQELNVVLGGTLHPHLHRVPELMDHREDTALERADQYQPAHPVHLRPGGFLHQLLGTTEIAVNSLHGQGIRELADELVAEGTAPDGVVEAVSCPGRPGFVLGVQWHPEWRYHEDATSEALFRAFGDAVWARYRARRASG